MPTVSAIVPAHDAEKTLSDCLEALAASSVPPEEIICVDDGSRDDTWLLLKTASRRHPRLRAVRLEAQKGAAAARNAGAAAARGDLLFFTDSDCTVEPGTLAHLLRAAEDVRDAAAVVGLYRPDACSGGIRAWFVAAYSALTHAEGPGTSLSTQCALVRKDVFLQCGGFDESFATATVEDLNLGYEFHRRGHRVILEPKAAVTHHRGYTWSGFWRNYFNKSRAFAGVFTKRGVQWGQGYLHWRQPVSVVCGTLFWVCLAASPFVPWSLAVAVVLAVVQALVNHRLLIGKPGGVGVVLLRLVLLQVAMLAVASGSVLGLGHRLWCHQGGMRRWTH